MQSAESVVRRYAGNQVNLVVPVLGLSTVAVNALQHRSGSLRRVLPA